jgi:hypothetical protein
MLKKQTARSLHRLLTKLIKTVGENGGDERIIAESVMEFIFEGMNQKELLVIRRDWNKNVKIK